MTHYFLSHIATVITAFASVLIAVHLLSSQRTSQSLLAWIIALVFVPPIAIPLYLMFGTRKLVRAPRKALPMSIDRSASPIARVLESAGLPPPRTECAFELLGDGVVAYETLMRMIHEAKTSIHVSMFILGDDSVGWSVIEALASRARDGLDVKLILDAVGSRPTAKRAGRILAAAGGEMRVFMPLLHLPTRGESNLRSHRKLGVFDGARIFTGGMNLAIEYMGPTPHEGRFLDVAARASGQVACDAEKMFAGDWAFAGKTPMPPCEDAPFERGDATLQIVASGPDVAEDAFYDAILTAIHSARERVAIVTPYYVPDDPLQRALLLAARRGVRVQLIMPAKSNHAMADFARRGLLRELGQVGVELWAYEPGMVHAKAMIVDETFAFVGSPNLDMRSLYLNYENALFAYGPREVGEIGGWVEALRAKSKRDAFDLRSRFWLFEQLARLVSPEL